MGPLGKPFGNVHIALSCRRRGRSLVKAFVSHRPNTKLSRRSWPTLCAALILRSNMTGFAHHSARGRIIASFTSRREFHGRTWKDYANYATLSILRILFQGPMASRVFQTRPVSRLLAAGNFGSFEMMWPCSKWEGVMRCFRRGKGSRPLFRLAAVLDACSPGCWIIFHQDLSTPGDRSRRP